MLFIVAYCCLFVAYETIFVCFYLIFASNGTPPQMAVLRGF